MLEKLIKFVFDSLMNPWVIFGFTAQAVFFTRVIVQWIVSEKRKEIVVPAVYWYLGSIGSIMIFIYAVHRKDIVFIASSSLNFLICIRSLIIHNKSKKLVCPKVN